MKRSRGEGSSRNAVMRKRKEDDSESGSDDSGSASSGDVVVIMETKGSPLVRKSQRVKKAQEEKKGEGASIQTRKARAEKRRKEDAVVIEPTAERTK
eukprot:898886-Rhodomonas_salina.1